MRSASLPRHAQHGAVAHTAFPVLSIAHLRPDASWLRFPRFRPALP